MSDGTLLFNALQPNDAHVAEELLPLVHDALRRPAACRLGDAVPELTPG